MAHRNAQNASLTKEAVPRLPIASYDSGYEFSLDHYAAVKLLVIEADRESKDARANRTSTQ